MKNNKNLKQAQVFTPSWVTNQLIDMLDQNLLSDYETFFFEPTCGDGAMLVVIVERIFNELLKKYKNKEKKKEKKKERCTPSGGKKKLFHRSFY